MKGEGKYTAKRKGKGATGGKGRKGRTRGKGQRTGGKEGRHALCDERWKRGHWKDGQGREEMEDKMESQKEQKEEGRFCNYFTHESKSRRSYERRKGPVS